MMWQQIGTNLWGIETLRWLLVGVVLGVAFLHPFTWWLSILGIALFIKTAVVSARLPKVLWGAWLAGFVQFLIILSWYWTTYPLDWLGVGSGGSIALIGGVWVTSAVVLALGKILFSGFVFHFKNNARVMLIGTPFVWLLGELLGSFLFSIYTLGRSSSLSADFSTGYLGYTLAEHGMLIRLAEWGGVFILSLTVAAFGYLFYVLTTSSVRVRRYQVWTIAVLVIATSFTTFENPYRLPDASVAALSTSYEAYVTLDGDERRVRQDKLIGAVASVLEQGVRYVVLPEDARLTSSFDSPEAVFTFMDAYASEPVILVDTTVTFLEDGTKVVAGVVYDNANREVVAVHKGFLMPTGEYLPYLHSAIIKLFGFGHAVERFNHYYDFEPQPKLTSTLPEGIPSILFCFEAVSSVALKQAAARSGTDFVVHPVSHSWFSEPLLLRHELDQMLRVNTLFARTTVYQASNQYDALLY